MKTDSGIRIATSIGLDRQQQGLPQWVLLHIPHDSMVIPAEIRSQFHLDDDMLAQELQRMTDHATRGLFAPLASEQNVICSSVSRLVVDVERFADDTYEPMAARGMGAVYMRTSGGLALRHPLPTASRASLMDTYYHPHHARLGACARSRLLEYGHVLILDCHSFASRPLPHEDDQEVHRPEICIGTDRFHTPQELAEQLVAAFRAAGFHTMVNRPFSGAMVPASLYRQETRALGVMVEVNRKLYMDETQHCLRHDFDRIGRKIRGACKIGINKWFQKVRWNL